MKITNGIVLNSDFNWENKDVFTDGTIISHISNDDFEIDAKDCYVVPGFIDTHMHAAMGKSFIDYDENTYTKITEFEAKNGTTSLVPALSAAPKEKLLRCINYLKECVNRTDYYSSKIYGIHLEGPFFSERFKGAHLPENIRHTDVSEFIEYLNCSGETLKIITLAPELPNADCVIKKAVESKVVVSVGHTDASYEKIIWAEQLGASQATHLFNAMSPLNHRKPGTVGAILISNIKPELICDFFHVHKDVVRFVYDVKGADNINMITDSELGTGLPDGEFDVNGRKIYVKDRKTYTEDGTIAGGTSCLIDGVRNLVSIGIPLSDACKMASKNPAQSVGIYNKVGSIDVGKIADIIVLDKDLNIKNVILRGNPI